MFRSTPSPSRLQTQWGAPPMKQQQQLLEQQHGGGRGGAYGGGGGGTSATSGYSAGAPSPGSPQPGQHHQHSQQPQSQSRVSHFSPDGSVASGGGGGSNASGGRGQPQLPQRVTSLDQGRGVGGNMPKPAQAQLFHSPMKSENPLDQGAAINFEKAISPNLVMQVKARPHGEGKGLAVQGRHNQVAPEHLYRNPRCRPTAQEIQQSVHHRPCTTDARCHSKFVSLAHRVPSASSIAKLFQHSVESCRSVTQGIIKQCEKKGQRFFDTQWPLDHRNTYYPNGTPDDCTVAEAKGQRRLSELYPRAPVFGPRSSDTRIQQGRVGDCFLLGAMMALHNTPGATASPLKKLIVEASPQWGVYGVVFYKNGSWEWVVIDDFVPMDGDSPLFCTCSSNETWPLVLEKAYAKMHHCWDTIDGGRECEALVDLSGGMEQLLDLYGEHRDMSFEDLIHIAESGRAVVVGAVGGQANETKSTSRRAPAATQGLLHGHAYQLVCGKELDDGRRLVQIRNHWGSQGAWKGPFGEGSAEWSQTHLTMQNNDPQVCWMPWEDFNRLLTRITVVEFVDQRAGSLTMYALSRATSAESTYIVHVKGSVRLSLQLSVGQEDFKLNESHQVAKTGNTFQKMQLVVQKLSKVPDRFADLQAFVSEVIPTVSQATREVDVTIDIDPGYYSVCPVTGGREMPLLVRAVVPQGFAVDIRRFDDKYGANALSSDSAAQVVSKAVTLNPEFHAVQERRAAKGAQLSAELLPKSRAPRVVGNLGPEHIYRRPRCKPTFQEMTRDSCLAPAIVSRSEPVSLDNRIPSSVLLQSQYDAAAAACQATVRNIVAACKKSRMQYMDKEWSLSERVSLYPDGTPPDCTVAEPAVLSRLSGLFPNCPLFGKNPAETVVQQGRLGDCFLLGAMMALHNTPGATASPLKKLIVEASPQWGVYGVVFYKNGSWEWVVIDDFVPVEADSPLYCSCPSKELWPLVLEKAYAKMHHCWDTIDGGFEHEALVDLTGGTEQLMDLRGPEKNMAFEDFAQLAKGASSGGSAPSGAVMVASVGTHMAESNLPASQRRPIGGHQEQRKGVETTNGLLHGHAYHIIDGYTDPTDGLQFVLVRNFWGAGAAWKGLYSEGSAEWKRNPHHAKAMLPRVEREARGNLFWMPWAEFRSILTKVAVVLPIPQPAATLGLFLYNMGKKNPACPDQTYVIEVGGGGGKFCLGTGGMTGTMKHRLLWTLGQEDPKTSLDHHRAKTEGFAMLKLSIYRLKKVPQRYADLQACLDCKVGSHEASYAKQIDLTLDLASGHYSVIAKLKDCREGIPFFVRLAIPPFSSPEDPHNGTFVSSYRLDNPATTFVSTRGADESSFGMKSLFMSGCGSPGRTPGSPLPQAKEGALQNHSRLQHHGGNGDYYPTSASAPPNVGFQTPTHSERLQHQHFQEQNHHYSAQKQQPPSFAAQNTASRFPFITHSPTGRPLRKAFQ